MWQAAEPLTEERLDLVGTEAVTNLLKLFVVFAGEETVVERLVSDPAVLELLFGPLTQAISIQLPANSTESTFTIFVSSQSHRESVFS